MKSLVPCALAGLASACGAPPAAPPTLAGPAVAAAPPPAPAPSAAPAPPVTAASSSPAAGAAAAVGVTLHREIEAPVRAIALDKPPHAAALGADAVWIHDAKGWRSEPLPPAVRGASATLSLFYGRDFRVRLVGTRGSGADAQGVYLRGLPGGLKPAPEELGRLGGNMAGGLLAVLGSEDPEIVCRPGDSCLVKRASGWTTLAPPVDLRRLALGGGAGWAISGRKLQRLGAAWEDAGPAGSWDAADGLFSTGTQAWVVETGAARVHRFDGSTWQAIASPVDGPRALWGAKPDDLWLAGEGGLAHFDGATWRRAAAAPAEAGRAPTEAPGALAALAGRSADDVWIGGARGLYRVTRAR